MRGGVIGRYDHRMAARPGESSRYPSFGGLGRPSSRLLTPAGPAAGTKMPVPRRFHAPTRGLARRDVATRSRRSHELDID